MGATAEIREPAVSGSFYPRNPGTLTRTVEDLLGEAGATRPLPGVLKALLVPHAGYIFSGPVAARAYALLPALRDRISRVVVLGPAHHVAFPGLALPEARAFETPLGRVPVDAEAIERLLALPQVRVSAVAHAREHALEVQLPFLQHTLCAFRLVPLAVGDARPDTVAEALEALWGGPETLLVVSSDLSHYLPYAQAQQRDRGTCDRIRSLRLLDDSHQACGAGPINGFLLAAQRHHLTAHLLDLRNSGDTAGDPRRVVGYAAFAFTGASPHGS